MLNAKRIKSKATSPKWSVLKNHSLNRLLRDEILFRHAKVHGKVIDLGGGSSSPYYWSRLPGSSQAQFFNADKNAEKGGSQIDFERPLPFSDNRFDTVLCLSVLEHVYNHREFLREVRRILALDGKAYFWVPFFVKPHGCRGFQDFFRYTDTALERLFIEAGFSQMEIHIPSNPFWVIGTILGHALGSPRIFIPLKIALNCLFVGIGSLVGPFVPGEFPIGYFVVANSQA